MIRIPEKGMVYSSDSKDFNKKPSSLNTDISNWLGGRLPLEFDMLFHGLYSIAKTNFIYSDIEDYPICGIGVFDTENSGPYEIVIPAEVNIWRTIIVFNLTRYIIIVCKDIHPIPVMEGENPYHKVIYKKLFLLSSGKKEAQIPDYSEKYRYDSYIVDIFKKGVDTSTIYIEVKDDDDFIYLSVLMTSRLSRWSHSFKEIQNLSLFADILNRISSRQRKYDKLNFSNLMSPYTKAISKKEKTALVTNHFTVVSEKDIKEYIEYIKAKNKEEIEKEMKIEKEIEKENRKRIENCVIY